MSSCPISAAITTSSSHCLLSSSSSTTSSHDHQLNHIHSINLFAHYKKPKPVAINNNPLKLNVSTYPSFQFLSTRCSLLSSDNAVVEEQDEDVEETESAVSEEESDSDVAQSAEGGRLYVGNLPFTMTSNQLSEIFEEAGRVVSVEIVYNRVTDRSRGFAFVTMGSVDEAKEAIRLFDGAQIGGRTTKVNFPEVPRGGEREVLKPKIKSSNKGFVDSPHKIYAGNLSWNLTSQGLREAFEEQQGFLGAKVIYERESGRSRGFGFITFASQQEMESALNALNGVELQGRPLRLSFSEQRVNNVNSQVENGSSESNALERSIELLSGVST